MQTFPEYNKNRDIYHQTLGLILKSIQTILSEDSDVIIYSTWLDERLKKILLDYNKYIEK